MDRKLGGRRREVEERKEERDGKREDNIERMGERGRKEESSTVTQTITLLRK